MGVKIKGNPIPQTQLLAGANIAGKMGIDQTTPGTTNAVDLKTTANTALDSTNKVPVSLYGTVSAAGDTKLVVDSSGNLRIVPYTGPYTLVGPTQAADGDTPGTYGYGMRVVPYSRLYNGATWDRERSNSEETVLASAARTATVSSADLTNYNARGVTVVIDVTAITDTPSVIATVQGKDPLSGKYFTLLESAAITGTGTTVLVVHPSITASTNLKAQLPLPRTWRVTLTHADADSITYSIGALLSV